MVCEKWNVRFKIKDVKDAKDLAKFILWLWLGCFLI
ncbi:hypothetical protein Stok01_00497 [Sulfurisphaera tokodaii]